MSIRKVAGFIYMALIFQVVPFPAAAEDSTNAIHAPVTPGTSASPQKVKLTFDRWVDAFSAEWMRGDPNEATTVHYFGGAEQDALDRQLTPITREFRAARASLARRGLAELAKFEVFQLSPQQRISAKVLQWQLDAIIRRDAFKDYDFIFQQISGPQVRLVHFLSEVHPIRNQTDIENYLARLGLVAERIDEGITQAKERAARGILPPDFILRATIAQIDQFLAAKPRKNVLVTSLLNRMANLDTMDDDVKAKFTSAAERTVRKSIIPAFRRARALLQEQFRLAKSDAGLWRFPNGDKLYANALRYCTTTEMTAGQIHQLGLDEVKRIEGEMDGLLCQLGYKEGSVKDRLSRLYTESRVPMAPSELLAKCQGVVHDAERRAANLFDVRPKTPVEVRRGLTLMGSGPASYEVPAKDGSRPGIVYVPLVGRMFWDFGERTVLYHEGVPGHHFQQALQNENTDLPAFRRYEVFGIQMAYAEGWGLYAERLAAESGWYDDDPKSRLGELNSELFRARRLVVDTGLHALHWSRQQAIDYGIPASEVDRYVAWPGQACAYEIGMLKILELRNKAEKSLGRKFSLKEFHNVVLRTGEVPLDVLEDVVAEYIRDRK